VLTVFVRLIVSDSSLHNRHSQQSVDVQGAGQVAASHVSTTGAMPPGLTPLMANPVDSALVGDQVADQVRFFIPKGASLPAAYANVAMHGQPAYFMAGSVADQGVYTYSPAQGLHPGLAFKTSLACGLCPYLALEKIELTEHLRMHQAPGGGYECTICDCKLQPGPPSTV
jgi:hypothetical protein